MLTLILIVMQKYRNQLPIKLCEHCRRKQQNNEKKRKEKTLTFFGKKQVFQEKE